MKKLDGELVCLVLVLLLCVAGSVVWSFFSSMAKLGCGNEPRGCWCPVGLPAPSDARR